MATYVVYMLFVVHLRDGSRRCMRTQILCEKVIKIKGNCSTQPLVLAVFYYSVLLVTWPASMAERIIPVY